MGLFILCFVNFIGNQCQLSLTISYGPFLSCNDRATVNSAAFEHSFLIAGSLNASCQLVQQLHVTVLECLVIIELVDLKERESVKAPVHSLIQF
jgi:hypothetical protein